MAATSPALTTDFARRLMYSKYLLERANTLKRESNDLAAADAVLAAHDGVEMLMRVITDSIKAKPPDQFMQFWKNVTDVTASTPPHKSTMERLNNLRVGFKHLGNLPNPSVVNDLLPIVTAFCYEVCRTYLGVDLERVSLADAIPNDVARNKVKEAEAAFAAGDKEATFTALGLAFDELHREACTKSGFAVDQGRWGRLDSSVRIPSEARDVIRALGIEDMGRSLQKVIDIVNDMDLGIQPNKLRRFGNLTPIRQHSVGGSVTIVWRFDAERLGTDAFEFCHSFVIDFALRLNRS